MFQSLKNKKVLVMGLGIAGGGLGVVRWLYQQGAKIIITDLRDKETLATSIKKLQGLKIKYVLGRHRKQDFSAKDRSASGGQQTDLIIKNPAVPANSPYLKIAQKAHIPITDDIELFTQCWPGQIIALTGTKGKSTTVNLINHILRSAKKAIVLGGNVGQTPLLFLNQAQKNKIAILELSSFQLENLTIRPRVAIITNIFPDHLNRHKTMANYVKSKSNIFKNQKSRQYTILNYDNKVLRRIAKKIPAKLVFFSTNISHRPKNSQMLVGIKNHQIVVMTKKSTHQVCSLKKIKMIGHHNLENILAAVATAYLFEINKTIIQKAINSFSGINHRLKLIRIINGVKYYNDTAATNPGATIAALATLGQLKIKNQKSPPLTEKNKNIILIAGGADKNLSFNQLAPLIKKTCKQVLTLSGTATPKFIQALKKTKYPDKNIIEFDNLKKAIYFAKKIARSDDIVLLSPGCASFGIFTPLEIKKKNFKVKNIILQKYINNCIKKWGVKSLVGFANEFDRGEQFIKTVKSL